MFGFDTHGDLITLYTTVSTGIFVLAVRFGKWPLPQLVVASMVLATLSIDRDEDIAYQVDVLSIATLTCFATAFALLYHEKLNGVDTTPSKTMSLAVMFFVVAYYAIGVDHMINNMIYKKRYGGSSICDRYSIFGLGENSSWKNLKRAIEEDDLDNQRKAMGDLTALYHPVKCPLACRAQCNHTFQQIESIRNTLIGNE